MAASSSSSSSLVQVVIGGANQNAQAIKPQLMNNPLPDPTHAFIPLKNNAPPPGNNLEYHLPLYEATLTCNWKRLESFLTNNTDAIKTRITHNSGTVLHLAIATTKNKVFLKNLLDYVVSSGNAEVFRMKTDSDDTGLHYAASFGNLEAAKLLVEMDEELLYMWNKQLFLPIHQAANSGQRSVFLYLFEKTRDDVQPSPFDSHPGIMLTVNLACGGFCDLALEVVKKYTPLATRFGSLDPIASSPSHFRSGKRYNIWERIIYSGIPLNPTTPTAKSSSNIAPKMWHNLLNLFWKITLILFTVFAIFNAISLFSSVASLVMFLSMLTARYSEQDFLYSLPRRLIIGLVTLFISITSMMVTFGATIYLVFSLKKSWILISTAILGCLPVSLFALLQFPLLLDIISSTYGPGIFRKQGNRLLF